MRQVFSLVGAFFAAAGDISWLLFWVASTTVILTPGQDLLLVMSRSLAIGPMAGVITASGVSSGLLLHTCIAALGVGVVVQSSTTLYMLIKLAGAVYLAYLALSLWRTSGVIDIPAERFAPGGSRLFLQGALSNLGNVKIIIFFLAFLPQFIDPSSRHHAEGIFMLGSAFAALTFLLKALIGVLAGRLSGWIRRHPAALSLLNKASALVLASLAVRLLLQRHPDM